MKKLILVFFAMMVSVTVASAREVPHYRCGPWTLRGDYGVLVSGTRPSGPGGPLELMVGTAIDTFNGDDTFSQIDNIHGAISGYPVIGGGSSRFRHLHSQRKLHRHNDAEQ